MINRWDPNKDNHSGSEFTESYGNEGVLPISQSSRTEASLSDAV